MAVMTPGAAPDVLVLRALGMGDLLTALPALRALARAFPDRRRVLAGPRWLDPLVALTNTVDATLALERLEPVRGLSGGPEVAVNLHGRGPQSHRALLATDPRSLIAFRHPDVPESAGGAEWDPAEHEIHRWCRLLEHAGIPADRGDLSLEPPSDPRGEAARGATLLHVGAASGSRRWPANAWAVVAKAEFARGRAVLVTGGPHERDLGHRVGRLACLPRDTVYAGRTDLLHLVALVGAAGRVVCGDTGVAHLATALGTPSVVLFGPVSPAQWGPPPGHRQHRTIWKGRYGDPHARETDAGLESIRPEEVLAELAALDRVAPPAATTKAAAG